MQWCSSQRSVRHERTAYWSIHADDAMAILAAFNSPEVEVIGMTTIFGNVRTPQATANALVLRELAKREDVRKSCYISTLSNLPTL